MDVPKLLTVRLDRLESNMKDLERKQRCGSNAVVIAEKRSSDSSAVKRTLLDRVTALEHRLYQLWTEMNSSGSSNPPSNASTQAPTFNNLPINNRDKDLMPLNHTKTFPLPLPEISESPKKSSPPKQEVVVVKHNKSKKKEKKSNNNNNNNKDEKKRIAPVSWPHLKLLGC